MKLTPKNKRYIDSLSNYDLLLQWLFIPHDDPWLRGETGKHLRKRVAKFKKADLKPAVRDPRDILISTTAR